MQYWLFQCRFQIKIYALLEKVFLWSQGKFYSNVKNNRYITGLTKRKNKSLNSGDARQNVNQGVAEYKFNVLHDIKTVPVESGFQVREIMVCCFAYEFS